MHSTVQSLLAHLQYIASDSIQYNLCHPPFIKSKETVAILMGFACEAVKHTEYTIVILRLLFISYYECILDII